MMMSQSQYAAHRGVSQQAVSKAIRAGKIPVAEGGKIDPDAADAVWRAAGLFAVPGSPAEPPVESTPAAKPAGWANPIPDPAPGEPAASQFQPLLSFLTPPQGSAASEQAALSRARREKLEFEMQTARGELVPLREVEASWATMIISVRNRMLLIPDSIHDPTIRAQVDRLIREALDDACRLKLEEIGAA